MKLVLIPLLPDKVASAAAAAAGHITLFATSAAGIIPGFFATAAAQAAFHLAAAIAVTVTYFSGTAAIVAAFGYFTGAIAGTAGGIILAACSITGTAIAIHRTIAAISATDITAAAVHTGSLSVAPAFGAVFFPGFPFASAAFTADQIAGAIAVAAGNGIT